MARARARPGGSTLVIRAPGASATAMVVNGPTVAGQAVDGGTFTPGEWESGEAVLPMGEARP